MNSYQCWFCGESIERSDTGSVIISVESLWRWDAGSEGHDDPQQSVYAHAKCAKERMKGATANLEPSVFGEPG
jgi:hypothetical protein